MLSNEPIEYRYLNIDTKEFVPTQSKLSEQIGEGGTLDVIENYPYNQILIAGSRRSFTRMEAILICRNRSGIDIQD